MSSRSRAVRGCVMFRRMGKVSPPCKRTIEALRVCSVNMMYFSIFIVFVRPNVAGRLRFSTWRRPFHDSRFTSLAGRPQGSPLPYTSFAFATTSWKTSEGVHTHQKHPFFTMEHSFLLVGQIKLGMHVLRAADGRHPELCVKKAFQRGVFERILQA